MRVLVTGIGNAFTARHFGSSAVIEGPEGLVLVDCPDPIHRVLREASDKAGWSVDVSEIDDIILTHLHGDHSNGLESFGFHRRLLSSRDPARSKPRLHAARVVAERIWEKLAPAMDSPFGNGGPSTIEDFYDLRILEPEPGAPARIAGMTVRCRMTTHGIPTIGLLVSDGSTTLGWSGDTRYEPEHIDWLAQADVIVHEAGPGAPHTPIEDLNALEPEVRTKTRVIHLPDDFDRSCTELQILEQGQVIDLG